MKKIILCLLLAGCATSPPVLEPVTVDMPIVTPCVTAPVEKPDFALAHITAGQKLADKTKAALIELDQRKAFEAALEAQMAQCQ